MVTTAQLGDCTQVGKIGGSMKKVIMLALMLVSTPALAQTVTTSGTATPSHSALHSHEVNVDTDTDMSYGIGADVVVYSGSHPLLEEVRIDSRWDVNNSDGSVYAVAKVNLFEYLSNK